MNIQDRKAILTSLIKTSQIAEDKQNDNTNGEEVANNIFDKLVQEVGNELDKMLNQ
jgi:hypothetical protein